MYHTMTWVSCIMNWGKKIKLLISLREVIMKRDLITYILMGRLSWTILSGQIDDLKNYSGKWDLNTKSFI